MIFAPSSRGLTLIRSSVSGRVPVPALRMNLKMDPGAVFARHFIARWTSLSGSLTAWPVRASRGQLPRSTPGHPGRRGDHKIFDGAYDVGLKGQ
jgi:hypothetical protein